VLQPKLEVIVMLTDELDVVIGVDTHRDTHALAVVAATTGIVVAEAEIAASGCGYRQALRLAKAHRRRLWAIEGSGCYGAGLARFLLERGELVVEVERPARGERRRGKSDPLDALRAARSALMQRAAAMPRAGDERAALQALVRTRESAVLARTAALCQLRALIVTAPDQLRSELRGLSRAALLRRCRRLQRRGEQRLLALSLRTLARRIDTLTQETGTLEREIQALVEQLAPRLLAQPGVGPLSAAQLLIAWSHPGRLHSEAAFARLAGAAPIPASSGKTIRHRLDRGGDRQLNRALHTIVLSRRKHHRETIAYIQRRQHEGKTLREAIRCLKRYLARHLYRILEAQPMTT
jgi:transposase